MAKLTSSWIKHNLVPVYLGFAEMKSKLSDELKEQLLKPYLDQLPQAPKGYTANHTFSGNFSSFMPLADVYDKNGRTGKWKSLIYTKPQQAIIDNLNKELDAKLTAWTEDFVSNNLVLQHVLKQQPRLQKKYDRAYNRVKDTYNFNNYLCESVDEDNEDYALMLELEDVVHSHFSVKPIKHVLWDDMVEYTDMMSENYAEFEAQSDYEMEAA